MKHPNHLRTLREALGMTGVDMAKELELSRVGLSDIEQGKYLPSAKTGKRIEKYFGVTLEEIYLTSFSGGGQ